MLLAWKVIAEKSNRRFRDGLQFLAHHERWIRSQASDWKVLRPHNVGLATKSHQNAFRSRKIDDLGCISWPNGKAAVPWEVISDLISGTM